MQLLQYTFVFRGHVILLAQCTFFPLGAFGISGQFKESISS
jgi:hypothetical protein